MSRFLRTLAKVGLVELDAQEARAAQQRKPEAGLDEERLARILAEEEKASQKKSARPATGQPDNQARSSKTVQDQAPASTAQVSAAGSATPGVAAAPGTSPIAEGVSFEAMYAGAELPPSPYPAEKLLKLLGGLRAMDPATRKTAILAMDAADDSWTIDDVMLDAERKVRALGTGIERVEAQVTQLDERAQGELVALDQYTQQAADTIRRQIAELEAMLQDELQKAATRRAELQMETRSAREAAARERVRYEQEIERLREINRIFAVPAGSSSGTPTPSSI